ncbi:mono/diheme cytochrome c family protein [Granulicella aggregans]|uniref:Mono/diheme cytochrome c family protein n=1 Tax=Granulicella aggregans TaxID=474949 RepID=A0A7W7ZDE2_9BACT|nr:cytochrome c [Granulicella aggregans]MBB5057688.1 mono/diheme cytochrome c family protein [Granulicella aggregans]
MLRQAALIFALSVGLVAAGQQNRRPTPAAHRHSPSDLEVFILDSSGKTISNIFLSRAFLAGLPQKTTILKADENFPELPTSHARLKGVDLDTLIRAIYPSDPRVAAVALCRDSYNSPFPRQAILDHHPILVLTIDGLSPHAWARKNHTYDPMPYFIAYQDFVPSFQVLNQDERAQHPAEIIRLELLPSTSLFTSITPPNSAQLPPGSPVLDGFRIAQQNCIRCHNSGETGGTKAHRTWQHLAEVAKSRPDYFATWVHDPMSLKPDAKMPPNLKYDQATLKALTRYFQTFAP